MTSSLVGTVAVSFTIPLAVFFDVFFKNIEYPRLFFLGTIPMFFSFVIIILVSQYENWDPIMATLEKCVRYIGVKSNESAGYRAANSDVSPEGENTDHNMTTRISPETSAQVASIVTPSETPPNRPQALVQTNKSPITNNRRFDGKNYRLKKSDNLAGTSSISSRLYSDEDQEQSQSLIEADDNAYA